MLQGRIILGNDILPVRRRPRGITKERPLLIVLDKLEGLLLDQIVPFNLVVGRVFEQTVGLFKEGRTQLYVSPGTGTWGPVMRLGSRGEVTLFEVAPAAP